MRLTSFFYFSVEMEILNNILDCGNAVDCIFLEFLEMWIVLMCAL